MVVCSGRMFCTRCANVNNTIFVMLQMRCCMHISFTTCQANAKGAEHKTLHDYKTEQNIDLIVIDVVLFKWRGVFLIRDNGLFKSADLWILVENFHIQINYQFVVL